MAQKNSLQSTFIGNSKMGKKLFEIFQGLLAFPKEWVFIRRPKFAFSMLVPICNHAEDSA